MRYLRALGWYMLIMTIALLASSLWQLKLGSGQADFSFIIILPFAIGLLFFKKWAIWGTGVLGVLFTVYIIIVAVLLSFMSHTGVTVGLGPVVLSEPGSGQMWALAAPAVLLLGLPMGTALLNFKTLKEGIAQPKDACILDVG